MCSNVYQFSFDWSRDYVLPNADYYKHTQWFIQLFESWYGTLAKAKAFARWPKFSQ
jgi:leucyl-tRNA synthetase